MSVLYCSYCRRNVGSEGPTRDVRYVTCADCYGRDAASPKYTGPEKETNTKIVNIEMRLTAIEKELARLNQELSKVDSRTDPRLFGNSGVGY